MRTHHRSTGPDTPGPAMTRGLVLTCVLGLVLAAAPVGLVGSPGPGASPHTAHAATEAPRLPYEVRVQVTDGTAGVDLKSRMEEVSTLRALSDDPPATRPGLRRRLESDVAAFREVLRAEGFYAGTVDGEITGDRTPTVTLSVTPGPRYKIERTEVVYRGEADTTALPRTLAAVGVSPGTPARSDTVLKAGRDLVEHLRARGHPFAETRDRRVVVNHATRAMAVRLIVDAGPPATFGAVDYDGLERVERAYLDDMIPWRTGQTFDRDQLNRFRNSILETRLFRSVVVRPAERPEEDGRLPVVVEVAEAPPRSIGGGLRYSTDGGPGVRAFWEHRNVFGQAERLRANIDASLVTQSTELTFDKPRFLHPDQALRLTATAERTDRDAYSGLAVEARGGLDRRLSDTWRVSGGALLDLSELDDHGETKQSLLLGLPFGLARESVDDPLNPTTGSRLALTATPYMGQVDDTALGFGVIDLTGTTYWAPLESDRVVLAGRARVAGLFGTETGDVPPNRRLYAGGGGSVRGYGHQMVGPLDDDGDPLGGRSALELGLEARIKLTDAIGLVPFLDAGLVGDEPMPDFGEDVRWAAGLGGRYHTDFGPLRVDVGVPLNPREDDDWFQVYISLGQAF